MKKFAIITIIIALLAAFTLTLVGCGNDEAKDSPLEPVGDETGATLWQVVERIASSENIKIAEAMNLSLGGLLEINTVAVSRKLEYEINANINNVEGVADSYNNNFYFRINDADSDEVLLGIYADGHDVYLDLGEIGYKYENVEFNGNNGKNNADSRLALDAKTIITLLGEICFTNVKANENTYEFDYNIGAVSEMILPIAFLMANADIDSFAEKLGFVDFNDMTASLSEYGGKVRFKFNTNTLDDVNVDFNGNGNKINFTVDNISLKGENIAIDYESIIPERDYVVTKAINIKSYGEFYLDSDDGTIAKYSWELLADIDPFNRRDIKDNDDIFHLVIKNNTADNSDEFNQSKIKATDGVVLELAYAPKLFNTDNLLIAANLKSLLSNQVLSSAGVSSSLGKLLPDYYGTHIDLYSVGKLGSQGGVQTKTSAYNRGIFDIFDLIKFNNGSIEIKRELITKILGDDPVVNSLFDTNSAMTNSFKLNVNFMSYGSDNKDYALVEHFLYAANEHGGGKNFGVGFKPSKSSEPITDDGFAIATDIYGNKINTRTDRISYAELGLLIGGKMNYTFTDYWDAERKGNTAVKILGISGVDKDLIGVEQTIDVLTSMPDGNNLMGLLNTFNVNLDLPTNVYKVKIILTDASKVEFVSEFKDKVYRIGDSVTTSDDDCKMIITYNDGMRKIYKPSKYYNGLPLILNGESHVLSKAGEFAIEYQFGNVKYERKITVAKPDKVVFEIVKNIGYNKQAIPQNFGSAKLVYGNESVIMPVHSGMVEFPKGAINDGKMATYGDYYVKVKAYGGETISRVYVAPQVNRYELSLNGSNTNANVKLITSAINDKAPDEVKLVVTQEKKNLISWVDNGAVNAMVNGVSVADYRFTPPYLGDKTISLSISDLANDKNIRIRVQAVDVASGIIIGDGVMELSE